MTHFLKFLKIIVGIPFFAVIGVFIAFVGFLLNRLPTKQPTAQKQQQKEDLNKRKEQYRKQSKTIVIDDAQQQLNPLMNWHEYNSTPLIHHNKRQKKKELQKRRKRNKIARKSRQQNRK